MSMCWHGHRLRWHTAAMSKDRKFTSQSHLADMSLPPEQRGRKNKKNRGGTKSVPAQLSHGNGSHYGSDSRRKFETQVKNKRGRGKKKK